MGWHFQRAFEARLRDAEALDLGAFEMVRGGSLTRN